MGKLIVKPPFSFWVGLKGDSFSGEQVAGSVTNITEDSHAIERSESATLVNSYVINWEVLHPSTVDTYTAAYSSSDESIATIDTQGVITVVTDGEVTITVTVTRDSDGLSLSNSIPVYVSISEGASIDYVQGATGSVGKAFNDSLESLIASSDPLTAKPRFSSHNLSTGTFTRNEDFWGVGLDGLSSISPYNSFGYNRRAGTAVTKRHIICAAHFPMEVGATINFVSDVSGSTTSVTRTIQEVKTHPLYRGPAGDFAYDVQICLLDSDLPASIDIMEVLPSDTADYTGQYDWLGVASVAFDQDQKGLTKLQGLLSDNITESTQFTIAPKVNMEQGYSFSPSGFGLSTPVDYVSTRIISTSDNLYKLNEDIIFGDSGCPNCFVLGTKLVLIGTNLSTSSGTYIVPLIADINQLIADVDALAGISTGYTLTECDLSTYPTY